MDPDLLTPMYAIGGTHFYVNELAKLKNGQLVIPIKWIVRSGVLCADGHEVTLTEVCLSHFIATALLLVLTPL
jgi:hypothetical protein